MAMVLLLEVIQDRPNLPLPAVCSISMTPVYRRRTNLTQLSQVLVRQRAILVVLPGVDDYASVDGAAPSMDFSIEVSRRRLDIVAAPDVHTRRQSAGGAAQLLVAHPDPGVVLVQPLNDVGLGLEGEGIDLARVQRLVADLDTAPLELILVVPGVGNCRVAGYEAGE